MKYDFGTTYQPCVCNKHMCVTATCLTTKVCKQKASLVLICNIYKLYGLHGIFTSMNKKTHDRDVFEFTCKNSGTCLFVWMLKNNYWLKSQTTWENRKMQKKNMFSLLFFLRFSLDLESTSPHLNESGCRHSMPTTSFMNQEQDTNFYFRVTTFKNEHKVGSILI